MAEEEKATGHARVETSNFLMIVLIFIVVSMGGLVEIVPLFFQHSTTQPIEGLKPYTALQVAGRDVYIREGCNNCHSQMIRPFRAEALRSTLCSAFVTKHIVLPLPIIGIFAANAIWSPFSIISRALALSAALPFARTLVR